MAGGVLEYYEGGWKSAEEGSEGTFSVTMESPSVRLRMTYKHGVQEKSDVPVTGNPCVFRKTGTNVRRKTINSL
jgi:hypothetical protein